MYKNIGKGMIFFMLIIVCMAIIPIESSAVYTIDQEFTPISFENYDYLEENVTFNFYDDENDLVESYDYDYTIEDNFTVSLSNGTYTVFAKYESDEVDFICNQSFEIDGDLNDSIILTFYPEDYFGITDETEDNKSDIPYIGKYIDSAQNFAVEHPYITIVMAVFTLGIFIWVIGKIIRGY